MQVGHGIPCSHAATRSVYFQPGLKDNFRMRVLFPLLLLAATTLAADPARPNIVLIYADDLGYGDVGCYGSTVVPTPHTDRLAREGLRLINGYAASGTCTPSRYAMLTGEHPFRQKGTGVLPGDAPLIIAPDCGDNGSLSLRARRMVRCTRAPSSKSRHPAFSTIFPPIRAKDATSPPATRKKLPNSPPFCKPSATARRDRFAASRSRQRCSSPLSRRNCSLQPVR